MTFSSKMVNRITRTTASNTHTANAIRAQNNGGFSSRGTSANTRAFKGGKMQDGTYGRSILGRSRNRYPKALSIQDQAETGDGQEKEQRRGYGRTSYTELSTRNRLQEGMGIRGKMTDISEGNPRPRISGAANATARPVPKPNFRRPS